MHRIESLKLRDIPVNGVVPGSTTFKTPASLKNITIATFSPPSTVLAVCFVPNEFATVRIQALESDPTEIESVVLQEARALEHYLQGVDQEIFIDADFDEHGAIEIALSKAMPHFRATIGSTTSPTLDKPQIVFKPFQPVPQSYLSDLLSNLLPRCTRLNINIQIQWAFSPNETWMPVFQKLTNLRSLCLTTSSLHYTFEALSGPLPWQTAEWADDAESDVLLPLLEQLVISGPVEGCTDVDDFRYIALLVCIYEKRGVKLVMPTPLRTRLREYHAAMARCQL